MTYNKVYAQLGEERHIVLDPINYQYDIKQILVISGETLPEYYEADICNVGDTATLTMIGTAADGVEIPDKFFRDGRNVLVYVVIPGSGGDVQTRYDITIPSDERGERTDIELDTDQQTQADSLIAALNNGVARTEAAAEAAEVSARDAEAASEAVQNLSVAAETLATGEPATVEKTVDEETGAVTLNFGLPRGAKGDPLTYEELTPEQKAELVQGPILEAQDAAVTAVRNARTSAVDAVGSAGTTQVNAVNQAGTTQTGAVNQAGANQVAAVNQAGATQVQAVEDKGAEVLDSIPPDYSDLADDVADLSRQLSDETTGLDTKAPVIINTASGAIASFSDGADNMPIKKLVAQIEPVQDLHGYDHPWPAGGGANKWDEEWELGSINSNGEFYADSSRIRSKNYTAITAETSYYFKSSAGGALFYYDSNKEFISSVTLGSGTVITTPSNAAFFAFYLASSYGTSYKNDTAINYPATVTTYSPYSNECPISGWTEAEIEQTGKNLFDKDATDTSNGFVAGYYLRQDGGLDAYPNNYNISEYIKIKPSTTYCVSGFANVNSLALCFYDKDKNWLIGYQYIGSPRPMASPSNAYYCRLTIPITYINTLMFKEGSTATDYEPYQGNQISVNWEDEAGTVYGGKATLNDDGSVDLDATWTSVILRDLSASGFWRGTKSVCQRWALNDYAIRAANAGIYIGAKSNMAEEYPAYFGAPRPNEADHNVFAITIDGDILAVYDPDLTLTTEAMIAKFAEMQVVYPLATPRTYHFDDIGQFHTFLGTNNIWSSTGDTTVEYRADTKLYIDGKLAELQATILENIGG